jgi:hypothetical protein
MVTSGFDVGVGLRGLSFHREYVCLVKKEVTAVIRTWSGCCCSLYHTQNRAQFTYV